MEESEITGGKMVERIDALLTERNLKRQALADEVGISAQSFTHWKMRNSIPAADTVWRIARFFGVSMEWLVAGVEGAGNEDEAQGDEERLLDFFRRSDDLGRFALMKTAEAFAITAETDGSHRLWQAAGSVYRRR